MSAVPLAAVATQTPINILIVDDEPANLVVLESVLDDPGYRLVRALSADQALLALVDHEFALLILDVRLPDLTGFELAQLIKKRRKSAAVPIIFMTAYYDQDQHMLEGYSSGAVDYLNKPLNPAILRSKVAVFAELHRQGRELAVVNRKLLDEVAERRRAEEALRELNQQLEQRVTERTYAAETANRAKSDFLSAMSHELRTPLNAILGFAQLIESGAPSLADSQQRSVGQILKAGWYLLDLINEILDLAQVESGRLTLSLQAIALTDVLGECHDLIGFEADKRGVSLQLPQGGCPFLVLGDRKRVQQILLNLLLNAVKYNRVGGTVTVLCSEAAGGRVRIQIEDRGVGLSPEQISCLFQPFERLGREQGREEGTGIGLALSKRLVELMGGVIGVHSVVGQGSVFWVELNAPGAQASAQAGFPEIAPATVPARLQFAVASEPAAAGRRQFTVLCVEDNRSNQLLMQRLLARRSDMHLLLAGDGEQGVQLAHAMQPDVILMDINLPGLNGLQALHKLALNPLTARIPVIALSANAMPADIARGLDAGFFRYITKPIRVREFMATLDEALHAADPPLSREIQGEKT